MTVEDYWLLDERSMTIREERDALERNLMKTLVAFYQVDPVTCSRLCDDVLDRSGGLLGRLRIAVSKES